MAKYENEKPWLESIVIVTTLTLQRLLYFLRYFVYTISSIIYYEIVHLKSCSEIIFYYFIKMKNNFLGKQSCEDPSLGDLFSAVLLKEYE